MGSSAASIANVSDGKLRSAKFQLLFRSAEKYQLVVAFMLILVQR